MHFYKFLWFSSGQASGVSRFFSKFPPDRDQGFGMNFGVLDNQERSSKAFWSVNSVWQWQIQKSYGPGGVEWHRESLAFSKDLVWTFNISRERLALFEGTSLYVFPIIFYCSWFSYVGRVWTWQNWERRRRWTLGLTIGRDESTC